MNRAGALFTVFVLASSALAGCASARRSEALGNPVSVRTDAEARGQHVFMEHCHQCHAGGGGALGPAINDKPLPGFLIRMQVRSGLGAMPAFPDEALSDEALDDLVAYVKAARRSDRIVQARTGQ